MYSPRLLRVLLLKDRPDLVDPLPPCAHQLRELFVHEERVVLVGAQAQRGGALARLLGLLVLGHGLALVVLLALLVGAVDVLALVAGVEAVDAAVEGFADVEVLLVGEAIAGDGGETGLASFVRGGDDAKLSLSVS